MQWLQEAEEGILSYHLRRIRLFNGVIPWRIEMTFDVMEGGGFIIILL